MAKKDKLDFGDFEFDGNLDFDFEDTIKKAKSHKSKKPIDHVVDGVKDSLRTKFTDPSHLRSMMRKALPEGFGAAWDAVDDIATDAGRLYDDATKKIRPHVGSISRKLDQLVPESAFRAKKFSRGLKERFGESTIDNRFPSSFEENTNAGVDRMLAELDASKEMSAERRHMQGVVRDEINSQVEGQRFQVNQHTLGIIANSTAAVRRYMETYDVSWKKKSLELQFRSYAAQTSLLNNFVKFAEHSQKFQNALLLNTSLPEYAKTSNTQRWKEQSKNRIFNTANDALFGKKTRIGMAGDRLMKRASEKMDGLADGFSMIDDALAMALDARDMDKDMAEMEGRQSSGWRTTGSFGGSMIGDVLSDMVSGSAKKLMEKAPGITKKSFQVGRYAVNPGEAIRNTKKSKWFSDLGKSGSETDDMIKDGLSGLFSLLAGERPDLTIKNTTLGSEGEDKFHTQVRQARTINEIIPGYLARILREITVLRTGDEKTSLLTYDGTAGRFKTESRMATDLLAGFKLQAREGKTGRVDGSGKTNGNTYSEEFEEYYKTFVGDEKVGPKGKESIQKFLRDISRTSDDISFTGEGLKDTAEYKALSASAKRSIGEILDKRYTGSDYKTEGNRYFLAKKAASAKGAIGNLTGPIQDAIRDGHAELLEQQGLIRRNKKGDWEVDEKKYYDIYDSTVGSKPEDDSTVPSDINLKTQIKPIGKSSQQAINAFKNTGIYDWKYKPGAGYGDAKYTGPMAQDVRANFGKDAAPGGTKLDLVSLNGYTMSAVKGLAEKVDEMGAGEGLVYLKQISENTRALVERDGDGGARGTGLQMPSMKGFTGTGIAGNIGALISSLIQGGTDLVSKGAKSSSSAARSIGKMGSEFWTNNKEGITETKDALFKAAANATAKAVKFGSEMIFEKIPSFAKMSKLMASEGFKSVKGMLQNARDLYLPGMTTPTIEGNLLRAGYYRDKATNAVLKTMDELAKAKGDIIDPAGEVVLSLANKARGLVDKTGTPLRSFASAALQGAKNLGMAALGAGQMLYEKARDKLSNINLKGFGAKAKEAATSLKDKARGMVTGFSGIGLGGSDERIVPLLIQIRDILSLGKGGKRLEEILRRDIGSARSAFAPLSKLKANSQEAIEENTEKVGNSVMVQMRDLIASDKPEAVVKDIMERGKNIQNFLKIPVLGKHIKSFLENFKGMASFGESAAGQSPGAATSFGGTPGAAVNQNGQAAQGGGLGGLLDAARNAGGSLFGAFQQRFPNAGRGRNAQRAKGLLSKVRGSRLGTFASRGVGGLVNGIGSVASMAGGVLGSLFGGSQGQNPQEEDDFNRYSAASHDARLKQLSGDRAVNAYRRMQNTAFNDGNGDGQRDGGAADRMADAQAARTANEERKQAGIAASLKGAETKANRNRPADDAIGKMISVATSGLSAIAGMAGTIMSGIGGLFGLGGMLGKAGGLIGKLGKGAMGVGGKLFGATRGVAGAAGMAGRGALGVGGAALKTAGVVGSGIGKVASVLSGVGGGILGAASKIPGATTAARLGGAAMRVVQVAGLAAGGSMGLLSSMAAVSGAILTSPVFLGAAAIGGAAYGGYKLYKYLTRNNIDDWERIRILQYGLDGTNATQVYNSKVLGLEKYLLDGKLSFERGAPRVNSRAAKIDDIYELFDIDPQSDDGSKDKFNQWYRDRFQPVFLHHVALLYRIDNKASLSKIDKLDTNQKLEYLSGADISGVWNYTTSPFKGLDVLSDNPRPCQELIAAMTKTVGKNVQDKAKKSVKSGENKPSGADAANANKVITSAIPATAADAAKTDAQAPATQQGAAKPNFGKLPANSRAARLLSETAGAGGEEPVEPKNANSTMSFSGNASTGLKMAGGPLATGDSGMQYLTMGKGTTIEGLQPRMKKHLLAMAQEYGEATGKSITINEGVRTYQQQEALFRKYGPGRAARPGSSLHEFGMALDINTPIMDELDKLGLLRKYGFTRPIKGETWHMEPAGIQQAIQRAKTDASFADAAIMSSLGRGGGGAGAVASSQKGGRDPNLAMAIYNSAGGANVDLSDKSSPAGGIQSAAGMVPGAKSGPIDKMRDLAGPSYSTTGKGQGVTFSGNHDASASLGDGTGKYDAIKSEIAKHSSEVGADPSKMMMLAAMESGLNPDAKAGTSSAGGLMQFVNGTWKEQASKHAEAYGIDPNDKMNKRSQVILAKKYLEQNQGRIQKAAGRKLEFVDEYMGHMFGAGGASTLLKATPESQAARLLPEAAASNRAVFYDGTRPRTVAEVRKLLDGRIRQKAKDFGIALPEAGTTGSDKLMSALESDGQGNAKAAEGGKAISGQHPMVNPGKPQKPSAIAGFALPDSTAPAFTRTKAGASATMARESSSSLAPRENSPMSMVRAPGARMDASMTATTEVFARLVQGTDTQVKHLSSIDDAISKHVVPLLQKVVENTAALAAGNDSKNDSSSKTPSSTPRPSGQVKNRLAPADKSSFDNRRSATTV